MTDSVSPVVTRVVNVTVNSANSAPFPSNTTLELSSASVAFGQAVTFTATIGGGTNPGGSVTFVNGGTVLGTALVNGTTAAFTTSTLPAGAYAIQAIYSGGTLQGSNSNVVNLNVGAAATNTSLELSASTIRADQSLTLRASVSSPNGTPTGSVTFLKDGATLNTVALVNGAASLTVDGLAIGNPTFTVQYAPTANWAASASGAQPLAVTAIPTAITIGAPSTVATVGEAVTLTARVTSDSGSPNGPVTFFINGGWPVVAALANGTAIATFNDLPVGTYSFTAQYAAAGNWAAAGTPAAQAQVVTVQALPTSTSLTVSPSSATAGQPVTLTATVGSNAGAPSGNVTFFRNGSSLGTAALVGGVASLTLSNLPVGSGSITAQYAAAGRWAASTSPAQSLAIADVATVVLAGSAGIAVKAKGAAITTITLNTSRALNNTSALKATNYTLFVGRKVRVKGKTTILYDKPLRPTVKYTAGKTAITLTPPGGRLTIPAGVNAKLVVNGLLDAQNKAVTTYAVFFNKGGLVGVTTAGLAVPAGPARLVR
ncbi:MAG: Ig-like domain-containing protein [Isosphaeraceae bacterium]